MTFPLRIHLQTLVITFLLVFAVAGDLQAAAPKFAGKLPEQARARILDRIAGDGKVRLIVALRKDRAIDDAFRRKRLNPSQRAALRGALADAKQRLRERLPHRGWRVMRELRNFPLIAIEADAATLAELETLDEVASIQVDRLHRPTLASSTAVIDADLTWAAGVTGAGQMVAILDTGVDTDHAYFQGKNIIEACFSSTYVPHSATSLCPNGTNVQYGAGAGQNCTGAGGCDHGTHVAGIAAGNGDGLGRPSGVAKDADLIAIQVFSKFNDPAYCGSSTPCVMSYTSDQIEAMDYLYDLSGQYPIAAANMSLGGGLYANTTDCDAAGRATKAAIDRLLSAGIATVIAAGNNGSATEISSPGCISSAVSVGAVADSDIPASFTNSASWLDLWAPGVSITASVPGIGSYATKSGTSMATPHVTGAFALLREKAADAGLNGVSVSNLLAALTTTGIPVTDSGNGMTFPRISLLAASDTIKPGDPLPVDLVVDSASLGSGPDVVISGNFATESSTSAYGGMLLKAATTGLDRFRFPVPEEAGTYKLYAWWPASSANTRQAAVEIQHDAGLTAMRVDQTVQGARWNLLGSFGLTPGSAWVDWSDAEGGALAVDALRYERVPVAPLLIETDVLPAGEVGVSYSIDLVASGGESPYTWSLSTGALPPGVGLSADGTLSGIAVIAGTYPFTLAVRDPQGAQDSRAYALVIEPPTNTPPTIAITAPSNGSTFVAGNSLTLSATAADAEDGNLDSALTWTSTLDGVLGSGASVAVTLSIGSHVITARVVDSAGTEASAQVQVAIVAPPVVNDPPVVAIGSPANGSSFQEGETVVLQATATDVQDGNLNAAISWTSTRDGALGTGASLPAVLTVGVHTITASVTDSQGAVASAQVTVNVDAAAPPPLDGIDFNAYPLSSFTTQDREGSAVVEDGGATLRLTGNLWKRIDFPYVAGPSTYIEFDFSSAAEGEIHGIGLEEDNSLTSGRIFKLYGTQRWGIRDFDTYPGSGWTHYRIPVGQYYTGSFAYLVFAMDDDASASAESRFRNVKVYDEGASGPTLSVNSPVNGASYPEGTPVLFSATATDVQDGDLRSGISWTSDRDGPLGTGASLQATLSVGVHAITASVTDSDGASASQQVTVTIAAAVQPPPADGIDFRAYPLSSFTTQDHAGSAVIEDGGATLRLTGNLWKRIDFPYVAGPGTIIEFDFSSATRGEIHGIGLEEDNSLTSSRIFKVYGSQGWGIRDFDTYPGSGWSHYRIPVGQYYTGSFAYLVFVIDDDAAAAGESRFRNVRIHE